MKGLGTAAASAAVIMLSGAGAYAADLAVKAPVYKAPADATCSSILDFFTTACQVAAYGVRFYGTVDVGATYETHGAPTNKYLGNNAFVSKMNNGAQFLANPNGLSASNIGFQIKEPLGGGWSFVGQVEAGFNPVSMHLLNGVHSVFDSIGTPLTQQTAFGDSNSQGTFYNDLGFTGVSHNTWGTLTFFRQNDLLQDAYLSYDPMALSSALSPLGFFGGFAGGGDTQNRRDTTAIKYRVNIANWHVGAYGQLGGYDEGNGARGGFQGNVGADYNVGQGILSFDAIGAWKKDAVAFGSGLVGLVDQFGHPLNAAISTNETLGATISNNTTASIVAKYTLDRWKLYAGYEWIQFANPSDVTTAFTDMAGDFICAGCQAINGTNINNANFTTGKEIKQFAWVGARYALTDSIDVTGAYYHEWQNDFSGGGVITNVVGQPGHTCAEVSSVSAKCQGTKDTVSLLLDWRLAPKWDTYIGANYNWNTGADTNGYLFPDEFAAVAGVRFRW